MYPSVMPLLSVALFFCYLSLIQNLSNNIDNNIHA